jgi:hypothetical protein
MGVLVKTLLILILSIISASAWARVSNNTFVKGRTYAPLSASLKPQPKPVPKPQPKPAPVVVPVVTPAVVAPAVVSEGKVDPTIVAPIPRTRPPELLHTAVVDDAVIPPTPAVMSPGLVDRRQGNTTNGGADDAVSSVVADPPAAPTMTINDIPNCRYSTDCWKNVALSQEIKKVVANVRYVNDLHDTKIDPRYMLCTGYRESTFNPGAVSGANAKGLFQVIPSTGKAALRIGSKLQGFSNKSWTEYARDMVHSTLAQTEISFLVLKMKVREGASSRILDGSASVADYKDLAWRYIGKTGTNYSLNYRNHVTNCYSCLKGLSDSKINSGEPSETIKNCLKKAK